MLGWWGLAADVLGSRRKCAACCYLGTVRYITFPLNVPGHALEMDLCGEHLWSLAGRRMPPYAFDLLGR